MEEEEKESQKEKAGQEGVRRNVCLCVCAREKGREH